MTTNPSPEAASPDDQFTERRQLVRHVEDLTKDYETTFGPDADDGLASRMRFAVWIYPGDPSSLAFAEPHLRTLLATFETPELFADVEGGVTQARITACEALEAPSENRQASA